MKHARFTIFHKGLILIGGPLLFQLLFIALFLVMQSKEKTAEGWLLHTKDVEAQAELCFRTVAENFSDTRGEILTGIASMKDVGSRKEALEQTEHLKFLVSDNPVQVNNVTAFGATASELLQWVAHLDDLLGQGHRDQATDEISRPAAVDRLTRLRDNLETILEHERILSDQRLEKLATTRRHIRLLIGFSAGSAAILALVMLAVFSQNIAHRMARLTSNAQALGERRPLGPLLGGSDEIAVVDKAFHHAAEQLAELAQAEVGYRAELERRADELDRLNKDLTFKTQENETFVYSVSHDLRSPLVNLQGFSRELSHSCQQLSELGKNDSMGPETRQELQRVIDQDVNESVKFIQTAVSRAANIIDALLRLSRVGRVEYNLRNVAVRQVVGRVIEAMQGTIRQRGAQVVVSDLPDAWADQTAIEQVFGNLIGNAVNYLDPKRPGRIEIGSRPATSVQATDRAMNVYYVKDNGTGIPAAYLPKVFVAFQRLHSTLAPGEGIGLAMTRRMVERLGGNIWVESGENVGTTFFIALPPAEMQGHAEAAQ